MLLKDKLIDEDVLNRQKNTELSAEQRMQEMETSLDTLATRSVLSFGRWIVCIFVFFVSSLLW